MSADLLPARARPAPHLDRNPPLTLDIDLGSCELRPSDLHQVREHDIVPLDKAADEPVDLLVDGQLIARGQLVLLDGLVCVRVCEILEDNVQVITASRESK